MKYLIVTHHDADGSSGAAVIYKKLKETVSDDSVIDVFVDNLSTKVQWKWMMGYDTVFIVDHPYQQELADSNKVVVWLDHHTSAFVNDRPDIEGIRSASMAGCELAWLFCYGSEEDIEYVNQYPRDERQDKRIAEIRAKAPIWIRAIGDCDNWDKSLDKEFNGKTWEMFIGANASLGFSEVCPVTHTEGKNMWLDALSKPNINDFEDIIAYGGTVSKYNGINNMRMLKDMLMPARMKKLHGVKAAVLNTNARGSGTFDSVKDKYDIGAVFFYNKEGKVTVSMYSLNEKDEYDLGKLAKSYGGGGHAGAAGCTVNNIDEIFTFIKQGEL